jgi:UDP-N-acetylglucosamine--N-acetylmuramyl-(pentapeptide) pyrophosphoryl-undecaprenol N-acetylglucosamine transferase
LRVFIAGGGTAGHVNPAIALAHALQPDEAVFIGTARGAEARLVPTAGFTLRSIVVAGFDRAKPWMLPQTGARAARAVFQARSILADGRADVLVGMGGYVSLPSVVAARSLSIPVVLHEQNIVFGLAHKVSKPLADRIAVSFEDTLATAGAKGVYVGNPVGPALTGLLRHERRAEALARFGLDPARKTLLVFGGSQGARRINEAASGLLEVWSQRSDLQVLHITGSSAYGQIAARAASATGGAFIYRVVEFVQDMADAYSAADLALCRGGATTFAELAVVGLPAVIVPYPHHRDRQQERQGRVAERAGAAVVLDDVATNTRSVAEVAGDLLADDAKLSSMSSCFRSLARADAAEHLSRVVREVAA